MRALGFEPKKEVSRDDHSCSARSLLLSLSASQTYAYAQPFRYMPNSC